MLSACAFVAFGRESSDSRPSRHYRADFEADAANLHELLMGLKQLDHRELEERRLSAPKRAPTLQQLAPTTQCSKSEKVAYTGFLRNFLGVDVNQAFVADAGECEEAPETCT